MFERFSEAARVAMFGAVVEVRETGGTYIEPEHLLLGLLQARGSIAERLTLNAGMDAGAFRRSTLTPRVHQPASVDVPINTATLAALKASAAEADAMSVGEITTGHLLLGLLHDAHSSASRALRDAGVALNEVRPVVEAHTATGAEVCAAGAEKDFERRACTLLGQEYHEQ